jgi:hypothetical protein
VDPRVDAYIQALPEWQQRICARARELILAADPEIEETIKRSVQPYFVLNGNVAALLATTDHVNVFLYDPLIDDPAGLVTGGHDNQTGRTIAIYEGEEPDAAAFTAIIAQIAEHNRAGGWRKLTELRRGARPRAGAARGDGGSTGR